MGSFVLIVVAVVVAQTWVDWRSVRRTSALPEWARGMAGAGVVAATVASLTEFASGWVQSKAAAPATPPSHGHALWPEAVFLVCALGVIVFGIRKKRLSLMIGLTAALAGAFWVGASFFG